MSITNDKIYNELQYIKGKIDGEEEHAKQHREWEVSSMTMLRKDLVDVVKRVGAAENTLNWIKGIGAAFVFITGWLFKR